MASNAPRSEYDDYRSGGGRGHPPQGQGYDDRYDQRHERYDERYDRAPPSAAPPPNPYFDPPPRDPRDYPEQRGGYDNYNDPRAQYENYGPPPPSGSQTSGDKPYAPSEPRATEGNQLAPFDEEKADAEWRRGYQEQMQARYGYGAPPQPGPPPPKPPSDYDDRRRRGNPSRDGYEDERYDRRYDDDRYGSRRYSDDRHYNDRRRRSSVPLDEKLTRYPTESRKRGGRDVLGGGEGERGLGATLAGAGGGALLGHEFGDGALGTLGGAVAGALVAKVAENFAEKRKEKQGRGGRGASPGGAMAAPGGRYPGRQDEVGPWRASRDVRDGRAMGSRPRRRRGGQSSSEESWTSDEA